MDSVPASLHTAVDSLYDLAVVQGKSTSPRRLARLADACIAELDLRGLRGAEAEVTIPAGGRDKDWDVAWSWRGKYRLVISLKSILKNIPGTVPNRIDDAMGETTSIQLYSPEVVTGYVMLFDCALDTHSAKHGSTWFNFLDSKLAALSGRKAPYWSPGTFEGYSLVGVDFSTAARIACGAETFSTLFDTLVAEVHRRNPGIKEDLG